eukprot:CAMPEP_0171105416 /NCGR_PEP_ID=MMETSP0766_2-20121228/62632_1 /TAXON_ID=439317 /ORGANISM="Gambierdiscus australes, Strain CAWD 149" /LENGTH=383 /DNA_ID=CAMNT_0011566263 /DNA_START=56 /DNA_END=1207 /DNA_ORIENTATION=+
MLAFEPQARVRLHGLSNSQLNNGVGVVLPPDDAAEKRRLEESGRVKVSSYPKALSLKPENLAMAEWPDFATPPLPFTVLQVVRCEDGVVKLCEEAAESGEDLGHIRLVGELDVPFKFAESLWQIYGGASEVAARLPADFERVILDTPGHHLYWLSMQQIGHDVVIEACDGVWRGFQAMKKQQESEPHDFSEFAGVLIQTAEDHEARGYRAREWTSAERVGSEAGAYALWGGGRDLVRKDMAEVLRLISSLQQKTQTITERLREQAPRGFGIDGRAPDETIAAWAEEMLDRARLTLNPSRPRTPRSGESSEVYVFVSDVQPEHDFELPPELTKGFMRDYAHLTGEFPPARVFLQMLVFLGWETAETEDGGGMGWTLCCADLRNR